MPECKLSDSSSIAFYSLTAAQQEAKTCTKEQGKLALLRQEDEYVKSGRTKTKTGKTIYRVYFDSCSVGDEYSSAISAYKCAQSMNEVLGEDRFTTQLDTDGLDTFVIVPMTTR